MTAHNQLTIRLNSADNVVVARRDIASGTEISEEKITCHQNNEEKFSISNSDIERIHLKYSQRVGDRMYVYLKDGSEISIPVEVYFPQRYKLVNALLECGYNVDYPKSIDKVLNKIKNNTLYD